MAHDRTHRVVITQRGSDWDKHDRAWDKYYAEKAEEAFRGKVAASVDDPQMTDAEFRAFVRRALVS